MRNMELRWPVTKQRQIILTWCLWWNARARWMLCKQTSLLVTTFLDVICFVSCLSVSRWPLLLQGLISSLWPAAAVQPCISDRHLADMIIQQFVPLSIRVVAIQISLKWRVVSKPLRLVVVGAIEGLSLDLSGINAAGAWFLTLLQHLTRPDLTRPALRWSTKLLQGHLCSGRSYIKV